MKPTANVLVDTVALYSAAKKAFGGKIDYSALMDGIKASYDVRHAVAFGMRVEGYKRFSKALVASGYTPVFKEPVNFNGYKLCDWSLAIAMRVCLAETDRVVIASNPRRLVPLLKVFGRRISFFGFEDNIPHVREYHQITADLLELE